MKKIVSLLLVLTILAISLVGNSCVGSTDEVKEIEVAPAEEVKRGELVGDSDYIRSIFDEETGVMIYYNGPAIAAVQVANPAASLKDLTSEKKISSYISRIIDKENNIAIYYGASGFSWMSYDMTAVKIIDINIK